MLSEGTIDYTIMRSFSEGKDLEKLRAVARREQAGIDLLELAARQDAAEKRIRATVQKEDAKWEHEDTDVIIKTEYTQSDHEDTDVIIKQKDAKQEN